MLETESSKHCHVTSSRITHVGLRNHHSILSVTFPECLMLEDGIITTFYREFLPEWMAHFENEIVATLSHEFLFGHGSLWTMKCSQSIYWTFPEFWTMVSSQHTHVISSWIACAGLWYCNSIIAQCIMNCSNVANVIFVKYLWKCDMKTVIWRFCLNIFNTSYIEIK
jgi:hypothetical protein